MSAESCAESATTAIPQTAANTNSTGVGARYARPAAAQQVPLMIIAPAAIRALPIRSANAPATADPTAPLAMVTNAAADPSVDAGVPWPRTPAAADAKAAIQVHTAYS